MAIDTEIKPYPFYPDEAEQSRPNQVIDAQVVSASAPVPAVIEAEVVEPEVPQPERFSSYRLDAARALSGPEYASQVLRNSDQRLYAIVEGKEFTIDADGQRDPSKDATSPLATAHASAFIGHYWDNVASKKSQMTVEEAVTHMYKSMGGKDEPHEGNALDEYIESVQDEEKLGPNKELNYHVVAIRFFEDPDGNLRAVYGRSGRGTVLSQDGLKSPVEFAHPEDKENWQPTFVDVTPPLKHNTRLLLSSHDLTAALEAQDGEALAQAFSHNSERDAAKAMLDLGAEDKSRAAIVIDVIGNEPAAADTPAPVATTLTASTFKAGQTEAAGNEPEQPSEDGAADEPVSWRDIALGTKVLALEGIEKSKALAGRTRDIMGNAARMLKPGNLRKLFGRGKAYVQSGEFARHRKQVSGHVLGALATAKEVAPTLVSRERYTKVSQKLGHLARAAYLAPANVPQFLQKTSEYFRDEEKGKRRAYVAYAGSVAVVAAISYFATKGFNLDHHASDAHQQAVNHLPKHTTTNPNVHNHTPAAHHAAATAPKKQPKTVTPPAAHQTAPTTTAPTVPPAEVAPVTHTVAMTPGDTVWNEAARSLTTPTNPNPTNAQILQKTYDILNANHISLEQARDLPVGTVLTIPA